MQLLMSSKSAVTVRVRQVMRAPAVTVPTRTPVWQAAALMDEFVCSFLPVVKDGSAIGVVTAWDLITRLARRSRPGTSVPVDQVMTTPPVCVAEEMDVEDALLLMREKRVHRLIVVDPMDKVAGILSLADLAGSVSDAGLRLHLERHAERSMQCPSYKDMLEPTDHRR